MTGFEINEDLKDRCILLGCTKCYTQYVEDQKCWYNSILVPDTLNPTAVAVVCGIVDVYLDEMEYIGVGTVLTDVKKIPDGKGILYAIYSSKEDFEGNHISPP